MKLYKHFLLTTLFSVMTLGITLAQSSNYTIEVNDMDAKRVYIQAELLLESDTLHMSPYGPMPERWDDYVRNLEVTDMTGASISIQKSGDLWVTEAGSGKKVMLKYVVSVTHDAIEWPGGIDGVAFVNEYGYFLTGRSLFVMNGSGNRPASIQFKVPEGWNVSTPWKEAKGIYTADNQEDLMESLIMLGDHEQFEITKDELTINFVLSGEQIISQADQFTSIAQKTMDYYVDMMGGTPAPGGNRSANIMVTINEANQVDGEVIGGHISILMDPQSPPQQQMVGWFMFAHEFFHLWNGKTIQVSGTKEDWFKEGITNYYTLKALYQIGFINEQALAGVFNGLFYQRYRNDSGLGELSMREAAEGFSKDNHWGLIYGGGLFAGIAIDVMMREETNNEQSLDDLMRILYEEYAGTSETYTTEEIQTKIKALSGVDVSAFFETYIDGKKPIPIENYLRRLGFQVTLQEGQLRMSTKEEMTELERQMHRGFLGE